MWAGHCLPLTSVSPSVKQRKTGVWYKLVMGCKNAWVHVGQVGFHAGQQAPSLASTLSLFGRQLSAVWSQGVSSVGLSFLLHQVEAAGWSWNGHCLR